MSDNAQLPQVDYRNDPSHGNVNPPDNDQDSFLGTGPAPWDQSYDHPTTAAEHPTPPQPDRQIMVEDLPGQLSSYNRLGPNPHTNEPAVGLIPGYSPDLDRALAWERGGPDGSAA